jgi:hypothetical protein
LNQHEPEILSLLRDYPKTQVIIDHFGFFHQVRICEQSFWCSLSDAHLTGGFIWITTGRNGCGRGVEGAPRACHVLAGEQQVSATSTVFVSV